MLVNTHVSENVLVIECEGRFDSPSVPSFKQQVVELISKEHRFILLDFNEVEFMDSAALGVLVSLLKLVRSQGGEIKICRPNGMVQGILELTRFHLLFDIFSDREQAMRKMKAAQSQDSQITQTNGEASVL